MPGDPFADMGALETLDLDDNDLTSLETGVFDALAVTEVRRGRGECTGGGVRRWVMPPHMRARTRGYAAWTCPRMGRCAWAGGTRARGRPRPDGVMIVCPGSLPERQRPDLVAGGRLRRPDRTRVRRGRGECTGGGVRRWVMPPHMRARCRGYAAWTCARMGRCAWAGGTRARGRPRPDGVMIVCPGVSTCATTP